MMTQPWIGTQTQVETLLLMMTTLALIAAERMLLPPTAVRCKQAQQQVHAVAPSFIRTAAPLLH
jgi:hypothetical protein